MNERKSKIIKAVFEYMKAQNKKRPKKRASKKWQSYAGPKMNSLVPDSVPSKPKMLFVQLESANVRVRSGRLMIF